MTRGDRWAPVLVAVVATAIGGFGIGARDLAGDEIHMLVGDPVWIADRALDPRAGFVGHLPWSYWLRWCVQTVAGDAVWTWRLHSVVGAALATGLTCSAVQTRLGRRAGVIAGLMVALCPILAFHAQDSSNYAWSAASGALSPPGRRPSRFLACAAAPPGRTTTAFTATASVSCAVVTRARWVTSARGRWRAPRR